MFAKLRPTAGIRFSLRELLLVVMLVGTSLTLLRQRAATQRETAQRLAALGCTVKYEPRFGWAPNAVSSTHDLGHHCWHSVTQVTIYDHENTEYYLDAVQFLPALSKVELCFSPGGCGLSHASYHEAVAQFKASLPKHLQLIVTWVVIPVVG